MEFYILAVFRSRTQTTLFDRLLRSYHIPASVVSAPSSLQVGCSVGVKIPVNYLNSALTLFDRRHFDSFVGFYKITKMDGRTAVSPVVKG